MRIVAVADTHLFHDELLVPDGDVFVHAGDLCRGGTMDELQIAAAWIRALPHRIKIVVPGNHDWAFVHDEARARALFPTVLIDEAATFDGVRVYGSPWQPAYHGWAFNLPRGAALARVWAKIPAAIDVLITHGPPADILDESSSGGRGGCADLRARVRIVRPALHLFGHIHESGGIYVDGDTTFVNCTADECERRPTVVDLIDGVVVAVDVAPGRVRAAG